MLVLAPMLRVPYPILLVLGGLAIGFVPGTLGIQLRSRSSNPGALLPLDGAPVPHLPPRRPAPERQAIGLLAIGLVVVTTVGVAVVAHAVVDDLSWASAFARALIVSPTDPLAARVDRPPARCPRASRAWISGPRARVSADAMQWLSWHRHRAAAVVTGSDRLVDTGGVFVVSAGGGVLVGLLVGWLCARCGDVSTTRPPRSRSLFSLVPRLHPWAELLGRLWPSSARGVYGLASTPRLAHAELTTPQVRLQAVAVWEIVQYLLSTNNM